MQTKLLHIRIANEDHKTLETIANKAGLSANALSAMLLRAALGAAVKNDWRLTLPVEFRVVTEPGPSPGRPPQDRYASKG